MQDQNVVEISLNPAYLMPAAGPFAQYYSAQPQNAVRIYVPRLTTEVRGSSYERGLSYLGFWVCIFSLLLTY